MNRHLDQLDRDEALNEAVEKLANELMKPGAEYDPFLGSHILEAWCEAGDDTLLAFEKAVRGEHIRLPLLELIRTQSTDYWQILAEKEAEKLLQTERDSNEQGRD